MNYGIRKKSEAAKQLKISLRKIESKKSEAPVPSNEIWYLK